jgi:threonine/homoserine/homoserine lactone efflux protein
MLGTFPLAIGILASPIAVIPAILMLLGPRPKSCTTSFLLGWVAGLGAATLIGMVLGDRIAVSSTDPAWLSWLRIVMGVLLLAYAAVVRFGRGRSKEPPKWFAGIQQMPPGRAFVLGLGLSAANPKVLLLALTAGLTMGGQGASTTEQAVAFGLFMVIGSIEVLLPLLAYIVAGRRAFGVLESARGWLERNNVPAIVTVVSVIGAVLLLNGVRGL